MKKSKQAYIRYDKLSIKLTIDTNTEKINRDNTLSSENQSALRATESMKKYLIRFSSSPLAEAVAPQKIIIFDSRKFKNILTNCSSKNFSCSPALLVLLGTQNLCYIKT